MSRQHRRQIKNYLLDKKFQLSFTLIIVVTSAMLTGGLGYFWYKEARVASRTAKVHAMAMLPEAELQDLDQEFEKKDRERLMILIGFGSLLAVVLALYGIVVSHKVAGPLFKISRHMQEIEENKLYELWDLRKGDQLVAFWNNFRSMHVVLRERAQNEAEIVEKGIAALEAGKGADDEDVKALAQLAVEKRASLERPT